MVQLCVMDQHVTPFFNSLFEYDGLEFRTTIRLISIQLVLMSWFTSYIIMEL